MFLRLSLTIKSAFSNGLVPSGNKHLIQWWPWSVIPCGITRSPWPLTGKIAYSEDVGENWQSYNGTTLYSGRVSHRTFICTWLVPPGVLAAARAPSRPCAMAPWASAAGMVLAGPPLPCLLGEVIWGRGSAGCNRDASEELNSVNYPCHTHNLWSIYYPVILCCLLK